MKKIPAPTVIKTLPVATALIQAAVTKAPIVPPPSPVSPKINVQPVSYAPDDSGKPMKQFEVLIGTADSAYPNTYLAERACIEAATHAGYSNYILAASDPGTFRILAW